MAVFDFSKDPADENIDFGTKRQTLGIIRHPDATGVEFMIRGDAAFVSSMGFDCLNT